MIFPVRKSAMGVVDEFSKNKTIPNNKIPQIHSSTAFPSTQKKQCYKLQYQDGSEPNFGGNPQQTQILSPIFQENFPIWPGRRSWEKNSSCFFQVWPHLHPDGLFHDRIRPWRNPIHGNQLRNGSNQSALWVVPWQYSGGDFFVKSLTTFFVIIRILR